MKINLILLAAGNSSRFKTNKLLENINGKKMYMNVVEKVLGLNFNKIVLVTQYEEIKTSLKGEKIDVVMNKDSKLGISHSVKLGMERDLDADAYMFMVCDQPFISSRSIEILMNRFIKSDKGMVCVVYKDKLGNPTIFSKKYKDELLNLKGDVGGKAVMRKHLNDLEKVSIENEIEMQDIDTREDLIKINTRGEEYEKKIL